MNYVLILTNTLITFANCWAQDETNRSTNKLIDYQKLIPELAKVTEIQFGELGIDVPSAPAVPPTQYSQYRRSITDKDTIHAVVDCLSKQQPIKTVSWLYRSYPVLFLDRSRNVILGFAYNPETNPKYGFLYCGFKSSKEYGHICNLDPGWSKGGMLIHSEILADIIENTISYKKENSGKYQPNDD